MIALFDSFSNWVLFRRGRKLVRGIGHPRMPRVHPMKDNKPQIYHPVNLVGHLAL